MKEVRLGTKNKSTGSKRVLPKKREIRFQDRISPLKPKELKPVAPVSGMSKTSRMILAVLGVFVLIAVGLVYYAWSHFISDILAGNNCEGGECSSGGGLFGSLIEEPELKKTGNLTNALLVGIDTRKDQPGLMNTDTIMVVTYNHDTNSVVMTSLPRDLYVKIPAIYPYWSRINAVYAQGVKDGDHDTGMDYLTQVVEELTGLPIHYHMMINYDGFLQVIDEVGGVEVCVETEFWGQYPKGEDWEQVHFEEGCQYMDGETALKYARTRYANYESGEASDFARAKRQQKVIIATKDKVLSAETLLNPLTLVEFVKIAGENIRLSPYNQEDIRAGIATLQSFDNSKITSLVLEPTIAGGSLIHVIPGDAYFLGSATGSWKDVHDFVLSVIADPGLYQEDAIIYVYNGGAPVGGAGLIVEEIIDGSPMLNARVGGNMGARDFEGITVYDFTNGQKNQTLAEILILLPDAKIIEPIPDTVDNAYEEDIVIVVGADPVEQEKSNIVE